MEDTSEQNQSRPASQILQGQVVLITGASRGIGAATAKLFARHGAVVAVNYHRNAAAAAAVVAAIEAEGGRALAVQASVDDLEAIQAMVQRVEQELGPVETLVMSATASLGQSPFTPFLSSNWEQYQWAVLASLVGVYLPARVVAPLMVERKRGNLIAVSSLTARAPFPGVGALTAGKASVDALMRSLVAELGPHGIRVNIVAPGTIETEASAQLLEQRKEMLSSTLPLRRIGQPEDVAGAILLLATSQASYLTGNYLAVGGGGYLPS